MRRSVVTRPGLLLMVLQLAGCSLVFWAGRRSLRWETRPAVSAEAPSTDRVAAAMAAEGGDKQECEMAYWSGRHRLEAGNLENSHYLKIYTDTFDLELGFYANKSILDVGCGPRGSLEWAATTARLAVCADPLAWDYVHQFGAQTHKMHYVAAPMEAMPFATGSFDVVASFNNLDHVTDIGAGVAEMARVLSPTGSLLLGVHMHPTPTKCEPHATTWDLVEQHLVPLGFRTITRHEWEFPRQKSDKTPQGWAPFDHTNKMDRRGELIAHMVRN